MEDDEVAAVIAGRQEMETRMLRWLRLLAYFMIVPHTKNKNLKPVDLFALDGDKPEFTGIVPSKEERQKMKEFWAERDKKKKKRIK